MTQPSKESEKFTDAIDPIGAALFKKASARGTEEGGGSGAGAGGFTGSTTMGFDNTIHENTATGAPLIFLCDPLVQARCRQGFVEVFVVPGDEITMVTQENSSLCEFLSDSNDSTRNRDSNSGSDGDSEVGSTKRYRTFMSHETAWQHVCEQAEGSIAMIQGLVLRKERIGGFRPYLRTTAREFVQPDKPRGSALIDRSDHEQYATSLSAWDLMDADGIVGLRLPPGHRAKVASGGARGLRGFDVNG
eukprot:COSAG06_NODE_1824_length_8286_cov_2.483816_2_plen_247_part_00